MGNKKEKKNNRKKIIILTIICLICILFFVIFSIVVKSKNTVGNTIANIRNYGYVAEQGDWVYFVAPSDDTSKVSIYKSKINGKDSVEVFSGDWDILSLNIYGDYIYFIGMNDDEITSSKNLGIDEPDEVNNAIIRIKKDGSDFQILNKNEFHNNCYEIYVLEDKVFYTGVDKNIYSMNLDGTNKTKLNNDETGFLGISKDGIMYIVVDVDQNANTENVENTEVDETSEDGTKLPNVKYQTYIMDLDGENRRKISDERLSGINQVGDYIYYVNGSKNICKIKFDGTGKEVVSDKVTAYNMNIKNDKIYFMNYIDENATESAIGIYRMNLDGSNLDKIYQLDNYSIFLNTVKDGVVFMDTNSDKITVNYIDSKGENKQILKEIPLKNNSSISE